MSAIPKTQCFIEYFNNKPAFIVGCENLHQHYLETYLDIIKCQPKKEHLLFNIPEIMKVISLQNNNVQEVLVDIFETTLSIVDDLTSKEICTKYLDNTLYGNSEMYINPMVIETIYNKYPDLLFHKNQMLTLLFGSITQKEIQHRNDLILYLVNYPGKMEHAERWYENLFLKVIDFTENLENQLRLEILSHFIGRVPKQIFKTKSLEFWSFIKNELISEKRLNRKYAYFIVRQLMKIGNHEYLQEFQPNSNEIWHIFFTIYETLQEPSSHIVLPSLKLVPKLERLPNCWTYLLLIQYLKHENKLVVQEALQFVINDIKFNDLDFKEHQSIAMELINSALLTLNKTFIYANDGLNLEQLRSFFIPIFDRVKNKIFQIKWKSIPWYYICTSTINQFNFDIQFNRNENVVKELIKITNQIQNLTIRHYMLHFLQTSLKQSVDIVPTDNVESLKLANLNPDNLSVEQLKTILLSNSISFKNIEKFIEQIKFNENQMIRLLDIICTKNEQVDNIITDKLVEIFSNLKLYNLSIYDFLLIYKLWLSGDYTKDHQTFFEKTILKLPPNSFENRIFLMRAYLMDLCSVNKFNKFPRFSNNFSFLQCISTIEEVIDRMSVDGIYLIIDLIKSKLVPASIGIDLCFSHLLMLQYDTTFLVLIEQLLEVTESLNCEYILHYEQLIDISTKTKGLLPILIKFKCFLKHPGFVMMALTFGELLKGDQRTEYELMTRICGDKMPIESIEGPYVRSKIIFDLEYLIESNSETDPNIIDSSHLVNQLLDRSTKINRSNPRYFADSMQHRLKLRIVQGLATIFNFKRTWDERMLTFLFEENNQLNVTYIVECIIGATLDSTQIGRILNKANSNHSRQSIFIIMYYICKRDNDRDLAENCVELLVPWTMGQHFNTRIMAQIVIFKLIQDFDLYKHLLIYQSIQVSFEQKNAKTVSQNFLNDFRLNHLKYTDLLNPVYYLCEIPRLTNMALDELMPLRFVPEKYSEIVECLTDCEVIAKPKTHIVTDDSNDIDVDNIQKKITPIKEIIPDFDSLSSLPDHIFKQKKVEDGLVVVASLVTRSPNLGGLSRTCEIFGVEQLILDSLEQINSKEFQALSMTSEKWIKLAEVKPWNLMKYIKTMKDKGYCIIGAEQTANGKNITNIVFPKKSLLLLGHEKAGIPPNIISMLDMAVEIPQFGVVRSLNVHVTGAIFIWEYAKQHLLKKE